ncbi:Wall-associated receptor kinase-like 22 [Bienertia sinuspersici]
MLISYPIPQENIVLTPKRSTSWPKQVPCPSYSSKWRHFLEKQIVLSQGKDIGARQLKVLSTADIEKATNCYDPDFMVGSSFCSTVYIGILDDRIVVVKTPLHLEPDPDLVNRCLTAVSTAVEMNHDNIVKLYGCCLETFVLIQVYDFLPNGSLFQIRLRTGWIV